MRVARNAQTKRAHIAIRVFRFWFPLFLFAYLLFIKIVWVTLPLRGPVALAGQFIPAPIGITDSKHIVWYKDVLRVANWKKESGGEVNEEGVRAWVELRQLIESLATEMDVEHKGFSLIRKGQDLGSLHDTMIQSLNKAREEGKYQHFARERVEHMQSLIDLKIYFPDLAAQYSDFPSRSAKGVRRLTSAELPESYKAAIGKEQPTLVETAEAYVFVVIRPVEGIDQYTVTELGMYKQNIRETFYAYLLEHSIKWF